MKRLALILLIILVPAQALAQRGAGAFVDGFARGMAATRGQYVPPPPPVYQPPPVSQGTIYTPDSNIHNYTIQRTPNNSFGTIYGPNGITTFQERNY